jgi:hypothetical protein
MLFISSNELWIESALLDMSVATPTSFQFPQTWDIIFHPFTFNLCLCQGRVFLAENKVRAYFFNLSKQATSFNWRVMTIYI